MPRTEFETGREPARSTPPVRRAAASRSPARTAIWNALTALAIIAVLFITFYGLNSQRDNGPGGPAVTATAPAPQTTGQGGAAQAPADQTAAPTPNPPPSGEQGGAQNNQQDGTQQGTQTKQPNNAPAAGGEH